MLKYLSTYSSLPSPLLSANAADISIVKPPAQRVIYGRAFGTNASALWARLRRFSSQGFIER